MEGGFQGAEGELGKLICLAEGENSRFLLLSGKLSIEVQ